MEKKHTAVEWFAIQFGIKSGSMFEKAKEIEKEQMIRFAEEYEQYCYNESENNGYVSPKTPEQYYNETYGKETDRS